MGVGVVGEGVGDRGRGQGVSIRGHDGRATVEPPLCVRRAALVVNTGEQSLIKHALPPFLLGNKAS